MSVTTETRNEIVEGILLPYPGNMVSTSRGRTGSHVVLLRYATECSRVVLTGSPLSPGTLVRNAQWSDYCGHVQIDGGCYVTAEVISTRDTRMRNLDGFFVEAFAADWTPLGAGLVRYRDQEPPGGLMVVGDNDEEIWPAHVVYTKGRRHTTTDEAEREEFILRAMLHQCHEHGYDNAIRAFQKWANATKFRTRGIRVEEVYTGTVYVLVPGCDNRGRFEIGVSQSLTRREGETDDDMGRRWVETNLPGMVFDGQSLSPRNEYPEPEHQSLFLEGEPSESHREWLDTLVVAINKFARDARMCSTFEHICEDLGLPTLPNRGREAVPHRTRTKVSMDLTGWTPAEGITLGSATSPRVSVWVEIVMPILEGTSGGSRTILDAVEAALGVAGYTNVEVEDYLDPISI